MKSRNRHLGLSSANFLKEQGIDEEATTHAIKRVLAWQISEAMKSKGISKSEMAKRMNTSRSQLERFLHPENNKVLLETVHRAAGGFGTAESSILLYTRIGRRYRYGSLPHDRG